MPVAIVQTLGVGQMQVQQDNAGTPPGIQLGQCRADTAYVMNRVLMRITFCQIEADDLRFLWVIFDEQDILCFRRSSEPVASHRKYHPVSDSPASSGCGIEKINTLPLPTDDHPDLSSMILDDALAYRQPHPVPGRLSSAPALSNIPNTRFASSSAMPSPLSLTPIRHSLRTLAAHRDMQGTLAAELDRVTDQVLKYTLELPAVNHQCRQ